jgi:hypothetical protein
LKLQEHIISKIKIPEKIEDKKTITKFFMNSKLWKNHLKKLSRRENPLFEKLKMEKDFVWTKKDSELLKQIK